MKTSELPTDDDLLKPLYRKDAADDEADEEGLQCRKNEFGAMEVSVNEKDDLSCHEALDAPPKVHPDELLCCKGCGRYGMAGDFLDSESCGEDCRQKIRDQMKERARKERELIAQKQRREAKRKEKMKEKLAEERNKEKMRIETGEGFPETTLFEYCRGRNVS